MKREVELLKNRVVEATSPKHKVDAINNLVQSTYLFDPERAIQVIEEAFVLAHENGYKKGEAKALLLVSECLLIVGDGTEALQKASQVESTLQNIHAPSLIVEGIIICGRAFRKLSDHTSCLKEYDKAKVLAEEHELVGLRAQALFYEGIASQYATDGQFEWHDILHEVLQLLEGEEPEWLSILYGWLSDTKRWKGDYEQAFNYVQTGLSITRHNNHHPNEVLLLRLKGMLALDLGDYSSAFEAFAEALEFLEGVNRPDYLNALFSSLSQLYASIKDYANALSYAQRAYDISMAVPWAGDRSRACFRLGDVCLGRGDVQEAKEFYEQSLTFAREAGSSFYIARTLHQFGTLASKEKQYAQANEHFQEALTIYRQGNYKQPEAQLLIEAGMVACSVENYELAFQYFTGAEEIAKQINSHTVRLNVLQGLTELHEQRNEPEDIRIALDYRKKIAELQNLVQGPEVQARIRELTVEIETKEKEKQLQLFKKIVEKKSEQLASTALQLAEKKEILAGVQRRIKEALHGLYGSTKPMLKTLLNDLELNGLNDNNWHELEKQFNLVYDNFMLHVSQKWSALTSAELKVCALLRLGLSTKEMAAFLNVTHRAIDKHRNSIRKKIGLQPRQNLVKFFTELSQP